MSEWDEWSGFDSSQDSQDQHYMLERPGSGGWHWLLSIVAIVIVSALSMGMAYLTRTVEERPVWMMGLIFMVPTAALMIAVMMVEKATSAMTPSTSRRPQLILAIAATVATFIVACICDLIYLQGFKTNPAPAQSVLSAYEANDRVILLHDSTLSMKENGSHEQEKQTFQELMKALPDQIEVGLISGEKRIPTQTLTAQHRRDLQTEIEREPAQGRLYYEELLEPVLKEVEKEGIRETTRVIILSDGRHPWSKAEEKDLLQRCQMDQIRIYCVQFGEDLPETLRKYALETGGAILQPQEAHQAIESMTHVRFEEQVASAEVQEEIRLQQDLIRNRDVSSKVITCIMLVLEGLSLGICLSLMMSVTGQFRIQYFISPLMGVQAFVLLKLVWSQENMAETWWIKEGISFSLLGIVLMARNRRKVHFPTGGRSSNPDSSSDSFSGSDSF